MVTLSYGGTASDGVDYSTGATEVLIASGTTGTSLSITALQDALIEGSETIIVTITSVSTGVSLSGMQTQIITLFDDEAPVVSSSS